MRSYLLSWEWKLYQGCADIDSAEEQPRGNGGMLHIAASAKN
jgi:hypothetical protein